jgi:O-methyltransferase domain
MVDVGGGRGFPLATLLAKNPRLRGTLFDMPQIVAAAQPPRAKRAKARWNAVAGDFFHHVPEGADVYVLSRVLHDWKSEQARRILEVCLTGRLGLAGYVGEDVGREREAVLFEEGLANG